LQRKGECDGHQFGPDEDAVADAIYHSCHAMLSVVVMAQQLYRSTEYDNELHQIMQRFSDLIPIDQQDGGLADPSAA